MADDELLKDIVAALQKLISIPSVRPRHART
jgi:hypothetical protein